MSNGGPGKTSPRNRTSLPLIERPKTSHTKAAEAAPKDELLPPLVRDARRPSSHAQGRLREPLSHNDERTQISARGRRSAFVQADPVKGAARQEYFPPIKAARDVIAPSPATTESMSLATPEPSGELAILARVNAEHFVASNEVLVKLLSDDSPGGLNYYVSQTVVHGTFGKVRLALELLAPDNTPGRWMCIKEFRMVPSKKSTVKTQVTDDVKLESEKSINNEFGAIKFERVFWNESLTKKYVLMPAVDGSIWDLFVNTVTLSDAEANTLTWSMVFQLARDLAKIHDKNMVHRDLKPENFLCSHSGRIALGDFGLTTTFETAAGEYAGSRGYVAPEVLKKIFPASTLVDSIEGHTAASDIWSLGVSALQIYNDGHNFFDPSHANPALKENLIVRESHVLQMQFAQFVASITPEGSNKCDVSLICVDDKLPGSPHERWHAAFAAMAELDPRLCNLLLNGMLRIDPGSRCTARQLRKSVQREERSHLEKAVRIILNKAAKANGIFREARAAIEEALESKY